VQYLIYIYFLEELIMEYWNFILCMCRKCPISTTGWSTYSRLISWARPSCTQMKLSQLFLVHTHTFLLLLQVIQVVDW